MKFRILAMVLSLAALQWAGPAQAQNVPSGKPLDIESVRRNGIEQEQQLARQFKEFQDQVLKLTLRLERSPKVEDKSRAMGLRKVLDEAGNANIRTKFSRLQELFRKTPFALAEVRLAAEQTEALAKDLRRLIDLFDTNNDDLAAQRLKIENVLKAIQKVIEDQQQVRAKTEQNKIDNKQAGDSQKGVTKQTADIKDNLEGKDPKDKKSNPGGEAKDMKSQPKDGGKEANKKSGETRDTGKKKEGEAKDNKDKEGKEGKASEAKGADPKEAKPGSESKQGDASKKDSKPGENKDANAKDSKGAKGSQGEPKESKAGEKKQGNSKDAGKKDGKQPEAKEAGEAKGVKTKQEPKTTDNKPADSKAKDNKQDDNKAGAKDSKSSPNAKQADPKDAGKDSKQGEAKAGEPKSGEKSSAKSPPMQGQPKDSPDGPQAKGDKNDQQQQPPPPPGGEKSPIGKKQIQDALEKMKEAEKKIADNKRGEAGKDQGDAIRKLQEAKRELEKLLKQLREEELERLLANLKARCDRMLAMQQEVLNGPDGTEQTFRDVQARADKKPIDKDRQASARLADKEKNIVNEMDRFVEILEAEGSAVAFPEIARQVREDMKHVQRRLDVTDVGPLTQGIEQDIIDSLKDMIAALDKKKDEMDKEKAKPKPPSPPKESGPPPDQKLLDQLAELKMIRSMQIKLNKRTSDYEREFFPGQERPADTNRRVEVRNLAERQERIFEITNKIAKGDNK